MDSLGPGTIEPGTLGGQPARDDAHTTFASASLLQDAIPNVGSFALSVLSKSNVW